jgi:hypothetical protein
MVVFNVLYDLLWFVFVYGFTYKAVDYLFREYAQVVKILFDVNVRIFNYKTELSSKERHHVLCACSTPVSFAILTINPITHCVLYGLIINMIDVVDLNRILLYVLLFKIAKAVDLMSSKVLFRPFNKFDDANVLCQLIYLLLNYHNVSVAVPVLFQLIDEISNLNYLVRTMLSAHDFLSDSDTRVKVKLLSMAVALESRHLNIVDVKLVILGIVVFISFLYSTLSSTGEIAFYYYAVARIAHAYRYERVDKQV